MKRRYLLLVLAGLALTGLIYLNRGEITQALRLIRTANWRWLILIPVTLLSSFVAKAGYYQSFLRSLGYKESFWKLLKLTFGVSFVNQVSPAAGVSGATLLSYQLRGKVPAGKVTLIEYGRYILTHLSYVVLLILAMASVYFGASLDKIVIRIVLLLVGVGLVANVGFIWAVATKNKLNAFIYFFQRLIDRVSSWFRKGRTELIGRQRAEAWLEEFHNGQELVLKERRRLAVPFLYALLSNLMEVTTLYVAFASLGLTINPGKVIIGYAVANFAGAISLIPGDVGIYEITMVAAFSGMGITVAAALSATLLYRVLSKLITLSIGSVAYTRLVQELPASQRPKVKLR